ncbi:hypothetical protein J7E88_07880 [Streptomyces sp. ISL-10]|uniref:hypothetical protein n=1 Tax=Streptomyces sp. ISL-10 TaxID=2819172 RepID=UPI001BEA5D5E|nr:hypothetical protein [Streptomyces sp. ISL-10]MBT2365241.1 hypothetical protein [Streptomyces sp. ISL-10]
MSWASPAETLTWTGATVTQAELEMAQSIIELFAGTTELASDAGRISTKNLRLLKKAVAYQAVFMQEHPDLFTSMDMTEMAEGSGSGMQISLTAYGLYLAPLAKMCISQLSWKAVRSIRVRPRDGEARRRIEAQSRDRDDYEGCGNWEAL